MDVQLAAIHLATRRVNQTVPAVVKMAVQVANMNAQEIVKIPATEDASTVPAINIRDEKTGIALGYNMGIVQFIITSGNSYFQFKATQIT